MKFSIRRAERRCLTASLALLSGIGAGAFAQAPWIEARSAHYSVFYQTGFSDDARLVQTWADAAERLMKEKYGVEPAHYRMSIYLHPAPTTGADVNTAHNHCCASAAGGDSTGTIDMLAPSAPAMKSTTERSSLGIPKSSADYHAKILISEYIPIGHFEAQNARAAGGWKYYSAPNWFVQGLQEYDAIFHSTPTNRATTARSLSAWAASHPTVFSCCTPELGIADDYNGGAAFMTFLAVQFGEGIHARLLRSSRPTFADALTDETKPYTRRQLYEQFQVWLEAGAPVLPRTEAAIGDWGAAIVREAAAMIAAPVRWNRSDSSPCTRQATSISVRCALETAIDVAAMRASPAHVTGAVHCGLSNLQSPAEGNCGILFDEATVFSIARAPAISTGVWRTDATPIEVWSGRMINAGAPVLQQARRLVDVIAPGKYRNARLAQFNDDSTVTFANLQAFFRALEERAHAVTTADVESSAEDVEIELYADGAGIVRTYNGWFAVSRFSATGSTIRFDVDTSRQIAPNALDREIIKRADALLSSDAVWNRADNRKCDPKATTWSIYCALEHATREVTGGFHHRRPALEIVRLIVEERTKDRDYQHRLMDYNNDPSTHLGDVRTLFAEALKRTN